MSLDINKAILNPAMLSPSLQKELNGKYICKICGEIISRPGFCPICGQLEPNQYIKFKTNNIFNNSGNTNLNKNLFSNENHKNLRKNLHSNSNISESVGDTFSDLIGGNSSSISVSSLLYST